MSEESIEQRIGTALSELPDRQGGKAIVLATSSDPPSIALLSTGDVYYDGSKLHVGVHASSSAVSRLGRSFTLLIPLGTSAARMEAEDASVELKPPLARITGGVKSIRPTAEPPWMLDMRFRPVSVDHPSIGDYVTYWHGVRAWLAGEQEEPPPLPIHA